jgi:hypothetical protein
MGKRGRPSKILNPNDIQALQHFLEKLPYLKKNQQQALTLLQHNPGPFDETQLKLLKTIDREKNQYQTRHALVEQIQLKQKNQQPLYANEIEILNLLQQDLDQDTFFRLDRALKSYQKIEKATLENRIRIEKEERRELLKKTKKTLTEAQKKRNAENQLKYAIGGMVQSLYKNLNIDIQNTEEIPQLEQALIQNMILAKTITDTALYREIKNNTETLKEAAELLHRIFEDLSQYRLNGQEFHKILIQKHRKTP